MARLKQYAVELLRKNGETDEKIAARMFKISTLHVIIKTHALRFCSKMIFNRLTAVVHGAVGAHTLADRVDKKL